MVESQTTSEQEQSGYTSLRPAIVASREILAEYALPVRHLLSGLVVESVGVTFVVPPDCNVGRIMPLGVQLVRYPELDVPLMGSYNRNKLLEQLRTGQVNIIHCLCEGQAGLVRWLSRYLSVPYVLDVHSLTRRWSSLSLSSRRCAKIIAPAETIGESFAKAHPKFAQRVVQINPGIFADETAVSFSKAERMSGVVISHRLDSAASLEPVLGALRHLAVDGNEFVVALLGAGRAEGQVWRRLKDLGMLQTATIIPRVDSPLLVLRAADVFVLPRPESRFNPLLLEAMSIGVSVAACRGGVDDLIVDGCTAVTFDPDDEISIYNCLRGLFDAKDRAQQLARSAQEYVRENHKVSKMVSSTLQAYNDAVEWFKH